MITSRQNELVKEISKLHQRKHRNKKKLFILEGYHLYEEALKYAAIEYVFTTDQRVTGDNVQYVSEPVLEKLANTKSAQGIVTVCKYIESKPVKGNVLMCDKIQDPGNLGTLIRSALAFSIDTIVLDECVDIYNDKTVRSTQGALFNINIIQMSILEFMKNHPDYYYVGTDLSHHNLNDLEIKDKMAIIVGNEGQGIREEILNQTNINVTIPIQNIDSLNVGVAGSILMHHIKNNT